jgi:hypothetical protein
MTLINKSYRNENLNGLNAARAYIVTYLSITCLPSLDIINFSILRIYCVYNKNYL